MELCKHFPKKFEIPEQEMVSKNQTPCPKCKNSKKLIIDIESKTFICKCQAYLANVTYEVQSGQFNCQRCRLVFCVEKTKFKKSLKYPQRVLGCTGLTNLGNTCFINVILQVFSNLVPVNKLFTKYVSCVLADLTEHPKLKLVKEICNVIHLLWQGSPTIEPREFIKEFDLTFGNLSRKRHQDSQEFFRLFYDSLEESLQKFLKTQFLKDCFLWKISTKIICNSCKSSKSTSEEMIELPLSIPMKNEINSLRLKSNECFSTKDKEEIRKVSKGWYKKLKLLIKSNTTEVVSLYDCLVENFKDEVMNDPQNLIYCEKCGCNRESIKTPKIQTMPNVLSLQFKRYLNNNKKYPIHVQLPIDLDLTRFTEQNSGKLHKLTCIVSHRGDLNSGHYIAFCKNRYDNNWYKFDDRGVTIRSEEQVLNQQVYLAIYTEQTEYRKLKGVPDTFIPREWSVKYRYLASPGQYDLSQYLCPHENVSIEFPASTFIQANYEEVKVYSKNNIKLSSPEKCSICFEKTQMTKSLCNKECMLIENLYRGSNDYIVDGKWWMAWENFVKKGKGFPGKIKNTDIFGKLGKVGTMVHRVSKETWMALLILYSADMQITQEGFSYNSINLSEDKIEEIVSELEIPIKKELKKLAKEKINIV